MDYISVSGFQNVPSFIVGCTYVGVENINGFTFLNIWELPGLFIVFSTFFQEKVVAVCVGEAWSLNWAFRSNSLGAELGIVYNFHLMDMLAWVAVPKGIVTVLLPPLTIEIC